MKFSKLFIHLTFILFLTALTQVGGFIWIIALWTSYKFKKRKRYVFPLLYIIFNLLVIPPIAKSLGREKLPTFSKTLKPRNFIYPLLFRNYVTPELKLLLENASMQLKSTNTRITYLDANFPFIDGYPLLPHLSHNDGKKIDISFMYLNDAGNLTNKKPSVSGYGVYVNSENRTANNCINKGYWQYELPKYLTFGKRNHLKFDKNGTKQLVLELLNSKQSEKIFIEPYLKESLGLENESRVRFHGCQAVRHDDHIHFQIK